MERGGSYRVMPLLEDFPMRFTAVELFEIFKQDPYPFLLDSGIDHHSLGGLSFVGSNPFLVLKTKGRRVEITEGSSSWNLVGDPFSMIRELLDRYSIVGNHIVSPFLGGAVGYLSYDLCHFVEELPDRAVDDLNLPDCFLAFYDLVLIIDHRRGRLYICSTGLPETKSSLNRVRARDRLKKVRQRLSQCEPNGHKPWETRPTSDSSPAEISSNFTREGYLQAVRRAKTYIVAGDIYQVNISQRLCADITIPSFELYKRLRQVNPAPFAGFLDLGGFTVASASPERFLRLRNRIVQTRPMKGTSPRGRNPAEDDKFKHGLLQSEKDKAELIMIVDLERNDLGRVCEYGTVRVRGLRILENYATVFQTTSLIEGKLRQDQDRIDLLKACFPGGSITGAPKVRAMEIIDELEPTKRGIYTGSMGYFSFTGDMDLNIVIRTFIIKDGRAYFQVGGGIVYDSMPEAEYDETMTKAKGLIEALLSGKIQAPLPKKVVGLF